MSELRFFPRVNTELRVEVTNLYGDTTEAWVRNISPGGVMIDGDLSFKEIITLGSARNPSATPVEVTINFKLNNDPESFNSRCRLVFVRRLSQLEFNFGFRFVGISTEMAHRLQRYVANQ
ncbi:PilZ domain-containing protein [Motiliproteus sp. MSK22-1]|uniref:PilZ domain-containing protein n=1 Tax=Motiliproteus sp. MSK22-1 TaxID=1897630 RepID=UPI0009766B02|nr:PilZ domain-containing protein [Motiliproteus sp. MSK22-1]OMH36568.1 hypothetical protein BGP75_09460 [Motiliproteus sp. MSK22-1]